MPYATPCIPAHQTNPIQSSPVLYCTPHITATSVPCHDHTHNSSLWHRAASPLPTHPCPGRESRYDGICYKRVCVTMTCSRIIYDRAARIDLAFTHACGGRGEGMFDERERGNGTPPRTVKDRKGERGKRRKAELLIWYNTDGMK